MQRLEVNENKQEFRFNSNKNTMTFQNGHEKIIKNLCRNLLLLLLNQKYMFNWLSNLRLIENAYQAHYPYAVTIFTVHDAGLRFTQETD